MSRLFYAGLFTEGTTDIRFLEGVVKRTLTEVAFECVGDIEIALHIITIQKTGLTFAKQVRRAAQIGCAEFGISLLCVHTDADDSTDQTVLQSKFTTAQVLMNEVDEQEYCKLITPIIPVHMTEAWMLADTDLLKKEIGTTRSANELGLYRNPESIADPKTVIEEAIRIAYSEQTRRRRNDLTISELYLPMGRKISLDMLEHLDSYRLFKSRLRESLRQLNLMHD